MGKDQDDQPAVSGASSPESGGEIVRTCRRCVTWRCLAVMLLGLGVFLSAVFWLPPVATWHHRGVVGVNDTITADIIASFRLEKTILELQENIAKLEYDIYGEIGIPGTIVSVTSLNGSDKTLNGSDKILDGSGYTTVTFSINPYPKNTTISQTWLSILRSSFMSLVVQESTLHLTPSIFGNSSLFQVLKFPGGITIIPPQNAFLLLKPHAFFNFTLNFSIYEFKGKIEELKDQMKMGLMLNSYENLFVKLTNLKGSTVKPPTIIQTSIFLEVGNHQVAQPRLRQLAQTITNSSNSHHNLGLNHTTFGKVKQISLSSYLRHSLSNGGPGAHAPGPHAPGPHAPGPHHHRKRPVDRVHGAPKAAPPATGCRFSNGDGRSVVGPGPGPANEGVTSGAAPVGGVRGVAFEHVRPPSRSESGRSEKVSPSSPPVPNSACAAHTVKIGWFIAAPLIYLLLQLRLL